MKYEGIRDSLSDINNMNGFKGWVRTALARATDEPGLRGDLGSGEH